MYITNFNLVQNIVTLNCFHWFLYFKLLKIWEKLKNSLCTVGIRFKSPYYLFIIAPSTYYRMLIFNLNVYKIKFFQRSFWIIDFTDDKSLCKVFYCQTFWNVICHKCLIKFGKKMFFLLVKMSFKKLYAVVVVIIHHLVLININYYNLIMHE